MLRSSLGPIWEAHINLFHARVPPHIETRKLICNANFRSSNSSIFHKQTLELQGLKLINLYWKAFTKIYYFQNFTATSLALQK